MSSFVKGAIVGAAVIFGAFAVTGFQGPGKFGNIDSRKVLDESKPAKEAQAKFKAAAALRDELERYFDTYRCYADKERDDLKTLWLKDGRTKDEDTRLDQLKTLGQNRQKRQSELAQKTSLTPDETKELETLGGNARTMPDYLKALDKQLLDELNDMKNQSEPVVIARIKAVIQKIGQDQGLTVVYDSQIAPYAQVDITDAVIKELNK